MRENAAAEATDLRRWQADAAQCTEGVAGKIASAGEQPPGRVDEAEQPGKRRLRRPYMLDEQQQAARAQYTPDFRKGGFLIAHRTEHERRDHAIETAGGERQPLDRRFHQGEPRSGIRRMPPEFPSTPPNDRREVSIGEHDLFDIGKPKKRQIRSGAGPDFEHPTASRSQQTSPALGQAKRFERLHGGFEHT